MSEEADGWAMILFGQNEEPRMIGLCQPAGEHSLITSMVYGVA